MHVLLKTPAAVKLLYVTAKVYKVNVYTGDVRGAGTDANVFINMYGNQGDSGERKLAGSETHRDKFERNQVTPRTSSLRS